MSGGLVGLVILKCEEGDGDNWTMVLPEDVPAGISDNPEVVYNLEQGNVAQLPNETTVYAGFKTGNGGSVSSDIIDLKTSVSKAVKSSSIQKIVGRINAQNKP